MIPQRSFQRLAVLPALLFLLQASLVAAAEKRLKVGQPAIDLALEDTQEKRFRLKEAHGQNVILIVVPEGQDKAERQQHFLATSKWIQPIAKKYGKRALVIGLARLDIPFFAKGMAREELQKKQPIRFLIDWEGDVFKHYGDKDPTIVLIDWSGRVSHIMVGHHSQKKARRLFTKLDSFLAQ